MMGEELEFFTFKWREDCCWVPASEQPNGAWLSWNGDSMCFEAYSSGVSGLYVDLSRVCWWDRESVGWGRHTRDGATRPVAKTFLRWIQHKNLPDGCGVITGKEVLGDGDTCHPRVGIQEGETDFFSCPASSFLPLLGGTGEGRGDSK